MNIENVSLIGGKTLNLNEADTAANYANAPIKEDAGIFNLKFEPASFGGKNYDSAYSTSIFDDWDS